MGLFNFVKNGISAEVSEDVLESSAFNTNFSNLSLTERFVRYIDCPYKIIPQGTSATEVNHIYMDALRYGKSRGSTAVMVPITEKLANLLGKDGELDADIRLLRELRRALLLQMNDAVGDMIVESAYFEKKEWLRSSGMDIDMFENAQAQGIAINGFHSFIAGGVSTVETVLAQIPTVNPWEVFVWLPVGGMNGAPSDNEFVAISKLWNEMCGVIPAVISYGAVEYFVPRGKPAPMTAYELAKGQFAICPDRVLRMTRSCTLSELADTLTKSCVWYLEWNK